MRMAFQDSDFFSVCGSSLAFWTVDLYVLVLNRAVDGLESYNKADIFSGPFCESVVN